MKKLVALLLLLPLSACVTASPDREGHDWSWPVPKMITAKAAVDLVMFSGVVVGECRPFTASYAAAADAQSAADVSALAGQVRASIDAILSSQNLSEAERHAADLRELAPQVEALEKRLSAAAPAGMHGGCVLPVSVAGDPVGADGTVPPRRVVCAVGEVEATCRKVAILSRVAFAGRLANGEKVLYIPDGPGGVR